MSTPPHGLSTLLILVFLLCLVQSARPDFASDRNECASQLAGLATCLPYVSENSGGAPTPDCCSGLKAVLAKSPKCLCVLIKDANDPQLGIKINFTRALALPDACSAKSDISLCPKLLNLAPNSTEAAIFKQPGSAASKGKNTTASSTENVKGTSSGGGGSSTNAGGKTSFSLGDSKGVERVVGLLIMFLLPLIVVEG